MTWNRATPELPVKDVAETQAYYRDQFGFDIAWHNTGGRIGAVVRGDCTLFFRETDADYTPVSLWIFAEDIDALYGSLAESAADIVMPLTDTEWGLRQCSFRDLNGHHLIFHRD